MKKGHLVILVSCILILLSSTSCINATNTTNDRNTFTVAYKKASDCLKSTVSLAAFTDTTTFSSRIDFDNYYSENSDKAMVNSTNAFVYFIYLIYKNSDFPVTNVPVTFDCDYIVDGKIFQDNTVTMLSVADKENGKIIGDVAGVCRTVNQTSETDEFYLHIEIDFDFKRLTVGNFTIDMLGIIDGKLISKNKSACIYKNDRVYMLNGPETIDEDYVEFVDTNYYAPYLKQMENKIVVEKNFSDEYTESMNRFVVPN